MNSARDIEVETTTENAQLAAEELQTPEAGHGAVMWFNPKFGMGYIRPDNGGQILYVTAKDLVDGCRRLVRGRRVDYVVARTAHRAHAVAVREIQ